MYYVNRLARFLLEKQMWTATAPANIALIKYMGKCSENIASNVSLSYTLSKFTTTVTLELNDIGRDILLNDEVDDDRFVSHVAHIKKLLNFHGTFTIHSKNNFPISAGVASSASSFAALTICAFRSICEIKKIQTPSVSYMSDVSRTASGSSCRSFFSPWCIWNGEHARQADIPDLHLQHDLVMISAKRKKISSSEAHKLVETSLLMNGRKERAQTRCDRLIDALKHSHWSEAYQICHAEFCDMHALFETSCPHFRYITSRTMLALEGIDDFWNKNKDGPIVTIDAGPNVHLLWRPDSEILRNQLKLQLKHQDSSITIL